MKGCRALSEKEVMAVAETFAGEFALRDRALFLLGTLSGFRISELLSLRLADVARDGKVFDQVTVARRNMKRKKEGRTVPLNPKAAAALADWLNDLARHGLTAGEIFLFRSRKGDNRPITRQGAHAILKGAFQVNGLGGKTGTHSMRKSFAARIYDKAVDLQRAGASVDPLTFCQKALGHRNINSTISYLSFREDLVNQAILAL